MEIIFKDEPVKYVHTKFGDFLYSKVIDILDSLFDNDYIVIGKDEKDLKNWLIDEKVIKIDIYNNEIYTRDENNYKFYQELTEHERILDKLIGE